MGNNENRISNISKEKSENEDLLFEAEAPSK
jgi:hypothetical protein